MTPTQIMELLEPVRPELCKHFQIIDIQPVQRLKLVPEGDFEGWIEEVVIRLIK